MNEISDFHIYQSVISKKYLISAGIWNTTKEEIVRFTLIRDFDSKEKAEEFLRNFTKK